jgi:hypothetical protein
MNPEHAVTQAALGARPCWILLGTAYSWQKLMSAIRWTRKDQGQCPPVIVYPARRKSSAKSFSISAAASNAIGLRAPEKNAVRLHLPPA